MNFSLSHHFRENLRLAVPISMGQLGIMTAGLADNIMVGHLGYEYLAASSLGNALQIVFLLFGTGLTFGLTTLVGKALGEKNELEIKRYFVNGLYFNLFAGFVLALVLVLISTQLLYFGQSVSVVALAQPYIYFLAATIVPHMLFMHFKQFSEGLQSTLPAMSLTFIWNGINILLNYIFIYGHFGAPAMGLNGAGLATFISRLVGAFLFFLYFFYTKKFNFYIKNFSSTDFNAFYQKKLIKMGLPIGIQFSLEGAFFSMGSIIAGWISTISLAAHQIALNIASTTFLIASGLSSASTIRVSKFWGAKDWGNIRAASMVAGLQVSLLMFIFSLGIVVFRAELSSVFVEQTQVIQLAMQLMGIIAFFQIFDGLQVVALGVLRGLGDVRFTTIVSLSAYWIISIPASLFFSQILNWGVIGIWLGFAMGLGLSMVALWWRFFHVFSRLKTQN